MSMSSFFNRPEKRLPELSLDPHRWAVPDNFRNRGISARNATVIPNPKIFRDVHIPYLEVSRDRLAPALVQYPTAGQMTVHLCLLECFRKFRLNIEVATAFEQLAPPSYAPSSRSCDAPSTAIDRWNIAVRIAVARFKVWYEKIDGVLRHASFYNRLGTSSHSRGAFTKDYLPPLDVLLVWYSYMNMPSAYRGDNLLQKASLLLDVCMPWDALSEIIDKDRLEYNLPEPAQKLFATLTSQSADLSQYLESPPVYSHIDATKAISVDLEEAVHSEQSFIDQMHDLLWLRSPALEGTLNRAMSKYSTLAEAMLKSPSGWLGAVKGASDLHLVYKTHLLYPAAYHIFCERAFESQEPVGLESSHKEGKKFTGEAIELDEECLCWICERIKDEDPKFLCPSNAPSVRASSSTSNVRPIEINKEQLESIKADVGFFRHVENFRLSHPPGTSLPTRAPTKADLALQKEEKEKKDRAGVYYGLGWTVEVVRPAVYDEHGNLLKAEKTKVRRSKYLSPAGSVGGLLLL